MVEMLIKVAINAAALWVAIQVVPQVKLNYGDDWWKLLAVAAIFALVNSYIRPIVKALSFPISIMTLGLVAFVINAALFLLVAFVAGQVDIPFKVGGFPPDLNSDAIVGAFLGAIVVSIVSTVLGMLSVGRRVVLR